MAERPFRRLPEAGQGGTVYSANRRARLGAFEHHLRTPPRRRRFRSAPGLRPCGAMICWLIGRPRPAPSDRRLPFVPAAGKLREDAFPHGLRDAGAVVGDPDLDPSADAVRAAGPELDAGARSRAIVVLMALEMRFDEDLLQPVGIGHDRHLRERPRSTFQRHALPGGEADMAIGPPRAPRRRRRAASRPSQFVRFPTGSGPGFRRAGGQAPRSPAG